MFIIEHINFSMLADVFPACFPIDLTMNRNDANKETNFKREHDFRTPNIQRKNHFTAGSSVGTQALYAAPKARGPFGHGASDGDGVLGAIGSGSGR